jgi:hypothetical protein
MRDPHVVSLRYRLKPGDHVSFDKAPPLEHDIDAATIRLEDGVASVTMKVHCGTVEEARAAIDPFLRAWELDAALQYGEAEFTFAYEDAKVVDRNPPPPGATQILQVAGIGSMTSFGTATLHVMRGRYPAAPALMRVSPGVETLWQRYEGYKRGQEPLLSMAQFCLTYLEQAHKGRASAAARLRIDKSVLGELGKIAATRGDTRTARSVKPNSTLQPLTETEIGWVEAAIKLIIRRVGEIGSDAQLPYIQMTDLPPL